MISITGLEVRFGDKKAVDGLDLDVPEGGLFGLLGPNGAGKTTTIRCIAGLQKPTAGRIRVAGLDPAADPAAVRAQLGVVPQQLALYDDLTVLQNLKLFAGLHGLDPSTSARQVEWALALAQLEGRTQDPVGTLSGGMKRRLNLVASLLRDPPIIVCDEPTTGVDPQSRNHLFETLRTLAAEGRTIVYTTHYMEEVEALCERVAIVDHGKLVVCDRLDALLAGGGSGFTLKTTAHKEALEAALQVAQIDGVLEPERRSLEAVFLELTGRSLRDAS